MAGHKTWAVGEEMHQADFQPLIADQIVAVFANSTARDAQWPSPPNGAVCLVAGQRQTYFTGTGWYKAEQLLAFVSRGTDAGPAGAEAAVAGLSVTATVPANRYIRAEFSFAAVQSLGSGATSALVRLKDSGVTVRYWETALDAAGLGSGATLSRTYVAASGSRTWTVTLQGNGGTVSLLAGPEANMQLSIYDAGGV